MERQRGRNSVEKGGRGRRGVEEFLRIRHASRPQNQEWMKKWHNATFAGGQGDTSKRPPGIGNPLSPPALAPPISPRHSNHSPRMGKKGGRGQTRGREEEKKQVDLKRALMRGQRLGGELLCLPPFSHCIGMESCVRGRKGIEWKGSACDGSRESVTSHGDPLVPPLFNRCPATNSLHPCSLLKEKKRGWPLIISRMATDDIYKNFCDI